MKAPYTPLAWATHLPMLMAKYSQLKSIPYPVCPVELSRQTDQHQTHNTPPPPPGHAATISALPLPSNVDGQVEPVKERLLLAFVLWIFLVKLISTESADVGLDAPCAQCNHTKRTKQGTLLEPCGIIIGTCTTAATAAAAEGQQAWTRH